MMIASFKANSGKVKVVKKQSAYCIVDYVVIEVDPVEKEVVETGLQKLKYGAKKNISD